MNNYIFFEEVHNEKFKLNDNCSVFQSELIAIQKSLEWLKFYYMGIRENVQIVLFTDSMSSLFSLKSNRNDNILIHNIIESYKSLIDNKVMIEFCWTKSHSDNFGNERADSLAKEATLIDQSESVWDLFPLSFFKSNVKNDSINLWDAEYQASLTGELTKKFFPSVRLRLELDNYFKLSFRTTQYLSGHGDFKEYLTRFKIINDNQCECKKGVENVLHNIFHCERFSGNRDKLSRTLISLGLVWPTNLSGFMNTNIISQFISFLNKI
jgi:ribonuclease HI